MKYKGLYNRKFDNHKGYLTELIINDTNVRYIFEGIPMTILKSVGDEFVRLCFCADYEVEQQNLILIQPDWEWEYFNDMMESLREILQELNYQLEIKQNIVRAE